MIKHAWKVFAGTLVLSTLLVTAARDAVAAPYMELAAAPAQIVGGPDDGMWEYVYDVVHAVNFHEYLITLQGFEADAIVNLHDTGDGYGAAMHQMWDTHTAGGWGLWGGFWDKTIRPSYYSGGLPLWELPSEGACVGCINESYEYINEWHNPFEYNTSIFYSNRPGELLDLDGGITGNDAIRWTPFQNGQAPNLYNIGGLGMTFRVVHPNAPGTIQYHFYGSGQSELGDIQGPSMTVAPTCIIGDANCDGYVDISGDILPGFSNFTGPGSFGKTRAQGDVEGSGTGATPTLDPHDGDVDVSDLLTMFGAFTGPPPDESGSDAGGLAAAEAGDPNIPDLIYDAVTGEVTLDVDGSGIIGYVLKNAAGTFVAGNHTPILGGVTTSLAGELSEAALSSPGGVNSIGFVFPTGMSLAGLTAYLTTNEVSRSLGAPIVPFDLVMINVPPPVPEPTTLVLSALGLLGLGLMGRRRRRSA